jgi:sugar phosphate isomerase/epimerase
MNLVTARTERRGRPDSGRIAMKYAFNTWAYGSFPTWLPAYTLDETIRRLATIGYDAVEIGCAAPHAWPAYLSPDKRKEIRKIADGEGIVVSSLLPAPGDGPGCNPHPSSRRSGPSRRHTIARWSTSRRTSAPALFST